ncbi:MAG: YraN family protein [Oscillospiraceae bacterium]
MSVEVNQKILGAWGEDYAVDVLRRNGYFILARNWHMQGGELDIVARKEGILAFIEVKTRSGDAFGRPAEAVTRLKQRRLIRSAICYWQENPCELQPRFDVFEVFASEYGRAPCYQHIKGAFELNDANCMDDWY